LKIILKMESGLIVVAGYFSDSFRLALNPPAGLSAGNGGQQPVLGEGSRSPATDDGGKFKAT
jgi:hypothetical protein